MKGSITFMRTIYMNTTKKMNDDMAKKTMQDEKQEAPLNKDQLMHEMTEEQRNKIIEQLGEASQDEVNLWGE